MKILIAVDGSPFSEAAVRAVATRLNAGDSQILLVHAIEAAAFFEQDASMRERSSHGEQLLGRAASELQTSGFHRIETRIVEADARSAILECAAQWRPDLIVVGSHGRKGLEKLLLGSVADSVARHASCSVLIVRMPADG